MADQTDYRHIKVNPCDDDDVVIIAGKTSSQDEGARPAQRSERSASAPSGPKSPSAHPDRGAADGPANSESIPTAPTPSPKETRYHETTLEDIRSSKMSSTQIIVIVVALIAIAAFVLWSVIS